MTEIKVKTGETVYTDLSADEVRGYLMAGIKTMVFPGWLDTAKTTPIYIATKAIVYIKR